MGGLAWWHWLLIIAAAVMLFGAKRLPDAARGLGRSLRILKSEVSAMHNDDPAKPVAVNADGTTSAAVIADPLPTAVPVVPVAPAAVTPVVAVPQASTTGHAA